VRADAGGSEFPRGTIQVGGAGLLWAAFSFQLASKNQGSKKKKKTAR